MYKNALKIQKTVSGIVILMAINIIPFAALAKPADMTTLMDQRVQSAQGLIKDIDQWQSNAKRLHAHAEYIIAQAERLKGEANKFEIQTPAINGAVNMNSAQLEAAKKQYQLDINQFGEHAKAYNEHLKQFQTIVGECHAANHDLEAVLQKYQLHVTQFHLPMAPIRPPHICGALQARVGDMSGQAWQMLGDQIRVLDSEAQLNQEEENLKQANGMASNVQTKAILLAQRKKSEAELAGEFGRLQEEYSLLESEKNTLDKSQKNTGVALSSVSGKVVGKKPVKN